MKLYNTTAGVIIDHKEKYFMADEAWDTLVNRDSLEEYILYKISTLNEVSDWEALLAPGSLLAPIESQEVWAAGVTWLRSRDARMEESETAASLYDRVYTADRPELFFKATKQRVSGHGGELYIRKDSTWNVPEPELTLFVSSLGKIQGYTVGNDMSSRSIEGENALYLPQAKVWEKCAGMGPCLYVMSGEISGDTKISMKIEREGETIYNESVTVSRMKRSFTDLVGYLFRECEFPNGCYLMTGTCLVPDDFTLNEGDVVEMSIDGPGTLINTISLNPKHK